MTRNDNSSILLQLGQNALQHQETLEEVKRRVGVTHNYFDCWIYGFLENKNFDIEETVAKLIRRDAMERNELASYDITDFMKETMAKGIIQLIGDDKEGRVTFYIVTNRDRPTASRREENKRNFDMWLSYGTRLRRENQKCRITMLINQTDASMWANTDMTFQADVALRIAKYYPGAVDRMYICKMNGTLAALAKPIFSRLPKVVSERIHIITESDIQKGKLLELFDENVLPVALGGKNACDGPSNWHSFADTITKHFTLLKAAVQSGKGVKEWELEQLKKEEGCEESVSQTGSQHDVPTIVPSNHRRPTPQRSLDYADANISEDEQTMLTCQTDDDDYIDVPDVVFGGNETAPGHSSRRHDAHHLVHNNRDDILEWNRRVTRTLSATEAADAFTLVELYESTFRTNLIELEAMELLTIAERFGPSAAMIDVADESAVMFGGGKYSIMTKFPRPLRSVIRGTLWILCLTMAFYFLVATIFAASVGCSMMTVFFYGMFAKPYHVYPYGGALLITAFQTSTICARGYELVRTSFRGRPLHCFRHLGLWTALQAQAVIFFTVTTVLFVVFCVYAARMDPLTGLQYSVASGWVICSALILLYHLGFLCGVRGECSADSSSKQNKNRSGVSLYLFFDVTEQYEDADKYARQVQRSYIVYTMIPILIAVLAGIAFMLQVNQIFLIACLCATTASGFLVNFLTHGDSWDHSATLLRLAVCFSSVSWLSIVTSIGFFGPGDGWGGSVGLLVPAIVVWTACAYGALRYGEGAGRRQWLFRLGFLIFVVHFIACIVMLFVDNWRIGLLILGLSAHSSVSFFRSNVTSKIGTLTATVGFLALLIATIVIGLGKDATVKLEAPLSASPVLNFTYRADNVPKVLGRDYGIPDYTACFTKFANDIDVVAMSIFSAMTYAQDAAMFRSDMLHFFPTFTETTQLPRSQSLVAATSGSPFRVNVFEDHFNENMTVVAFSNSAGDLYGLMESVTMWIESMAFAPISLIIPEKWTPKIVEKMSVVTSEIVPLRWKMTLRNIDKAVTEYLMSLNRTASGNESNAGFHNHPVFMVGHDIAGGIVDIVATRHKLQAATFGTPGMIYQRFKFHIGEEYSDRFVIPVTVDGSTSGLIGGDSKRVVKLECPTNTYSCRRAQFFVTSLQDACYPIMSLLQ